MAYPVALMMGASAALSAAGTGASIAAASGAKREANQAMAAELERQKKYGAEGQRIFQQSLAQSAYPAAEQQIEAGRGKREKAYADVAATKMAGYNTPLEQAVPRTVATGNEMTRQAEDLAQARYRGYDEWMTNQMLKSYWAQRELAKLKFRSGTSGGVLPYEIQDALMSQQGLSTIGQGLSGAGQVLGTYAAIQPTAAAQRGPDLTGQIYVPPTTGIDYDPWGSFNFRGQV